MLDGELRVLVSYVCSCGQTMMRSLSFWRRGDGSPLGNFSMLCSSRGGGMDVTRDGGQSPIDARSYIAYEGSRARRQLALALHENDGDCISYTGLVSTSSFPPRIVKHSIIFGHSMRVESGNCRTLHAPKICSTCYFHPCFLSCPSCYVRPLLSRASLNHRYIKFDL